MSISVIILAAGQGTRMKSNLPKVLHHVGNKPLVSHVVDATNLLPVNQRIVVANPHTAPAIEKILDNANVVIQQEQLGTADAVKAGLIHVSNDDDTILILYGDTPLIQPDTLEVFLNIKSDIRVLGFDTPYPHGYGRIITKDGEHILAIVEEKDASTDQKEITLCNSGIMALKASLLKSLLEDVSNNNAKGEYYLTDIINIANQRSLECKFAICDLDEVIGINDRLQLSIAETAFQTRKRKEIMLSGVTLTNPESVFFSADTQIGNDTIIEPNVTFGPKVTIESNCHIKSFSHIEEAIISDGCTIGPYARLRPGSHLEKNVKIGNFVEIKKSYLGQGAKVNHLSYIGDAKVGDAANIGAGTITCNYDGINKYQTIIGKGAFIGSNTALVAPVSIGDGALIGAGSTITNDVAKDALAVSRADQKSISQGAKKKRERTLNTKAS